MLGPSCLLHLPGTEAEDRQAQDGSGHALAPSEDGCQRGWLGAEGGRAVLVVTVQATPGGSGLGSRSGKAKGCCSALWNHGPARGPPALAWLSCPQCWRSSCCHPNALIPSPGLTHKPCPVRGPQLPRFPRKRDPYKDDTEQTLCLPEDREPRPPTAWYLLTSGVCLVFLEEKRDQETGQPATPLT